MIMVNGAYWPLRTSHCRFASQLSWCCRLHTKDVNGLAGAMSSVSTMATFGVWPTASTVTLSPQLEGWLHASTMLKLKVSEPAVLQDGLYTVCLKPVVVVSSYIELRMKSAVVALASGLLFKLNLTTLLSWYSLF